MVIWRLLIINLTVNLTIFKIQGDMVLQHTPLMTLKHKNWEHKIKYVLDFI